MFSIDTLQLRLPDIEWVTSKIHIKRLSKDFYWFSPLLTPLLAKKKADIIARPKNESELKALISVCVDLDIPLTVRGGGTGNYGQAVPLLGGVVVDMIALKTCKWISDGVIQVQAGMRMGELENLTRQHGWELRCMPSTYKAASIGGLFAGGFGGIGSVNYGPVATSGTVQRARILTIEQYPRVIDISGDELLTYHHTYGTNGIILELQLVLTPARDWSEYLMEFASLENAYTFCRALLDSAGMDKREISLYDGVAASYFKDIPVQIAPERFYVITLIASNCRVPFMELSAKHSGTIAWHQSFDEANKSGLTLMEHCWNHSTLQALKHDKNFTNLQTNYDDTCVLEQLKEVKKETNSEVLIHLEFIRNAQSKILITGLPLVKYTSDQRLLDIIEIHRRLGIKVNNSHTYFLEDGKHGGALDQAILDSKSSNDPYNLLNPGKIRMLDN
ncbi:FAD-binding oxidoreductase [Halomonas sp. PAMB 3264]|uniref:FAD-binding oxidoreductase n=1 Tax=Halomonas sp. PAMB 3264 TaxID=3075222 RepID=UPI002897501C|nr:FAD-binding oxidoreductase [Halomonas sp. PAMB 3264]WNL41644.1 FAD-binding oxidoreductase [Halomonas sp. PAMB 3264]